MRKVIHQMWYQGASAVPERYAKNIESWKRLHPSFEYRFWDESALTLLLQASFPQYAEPWRRIDRLIKKCDAARYLILYKFGGIYADMDTTPLRSLENIETDLAISPRGVILSEESQDPLAWKGELGRRIRLERGLDVVVGNAVLISEPAQAFWLDFLDACFLIGDRPVLDSFSTWHLSEFLRHPRNAERVAIVPSGHLLATPREVKGSRTYVVHDYEATWFDHSKPIPWEG